ncbi:MAG: hypothetical protein FDZ75_08285 [Actinobacteria bacterium]|nr:MAG: hypothetical protein FDZ75_08285 [Actinomycetota bacterium]
MVYDADIGVLKWFERALAHANPEVRRSAVGLLGVVDTPRRGEWLQRAEGDADPTVQAAAVLAAVEGGSPSLDLFESDFALDATGDDLEWQWEYLIRVTDGLYVPLSAHLVWLSCEDDATAKSLAVMKAGRPGARGKRDVALIVSKRLVNQYTRSARNMYEARQWHHYGRPRYQDP